MYLQVASHVFPVSVSLVEPLSNRGLILIMIMISRQFPVSVGGAADTAIHFGGAVL